MSCLGRCVAYRVVLWYSVLCHLLGCLLCLGCLLWLPCKQEGGHSDLPLP